MSSTRSGQAAVELLALIPALVVLVLLAWQIAAASHGATLASGAARAGARAALVGAPIDDAVRTVLVGRYAEGARTETGGEGDRVRVSIPLLRLLPWLPPLGSATAAAAPGP